MIKPRILEIKDAQLRVLFQDTLANIVFKIGVLGSIFQSFKENCPKEFLSLSIQPNSTVETFPNIVSFYNAATLGDVMAYSFSDIYGAVYPCIAYILWVPFVYSFVSRELFRRVPKAIQFYTMLSHGEASTTSFGLLFYSIASPIILQNNIRHLFGMLTAFTSPDQMTLGLMITTYLTAYVITEFTQDIYDSLLDSWTAFDVAETRLRFDNRLSASQRETKFARALHSAARQVFESCSPFVPFYRIPHILRRDVEMEVRILPLQLRSDISHYLRLSDKQSEQVIENVRSSRWLP